MRVIAIDGPSGSGKSTVAKAVAVRLGLGYLDTGAMYRAVAFAALARGVDPEDVEPIAKLARDVDISLDDGLVLVDGTDATVAIRGPEVTRAVSAVAANPEVRTELRTRQREWITAHDGGVVEGRDIGTVVCPDADLKVYLTARLDVRADRRHKEVEDLEYTSVEADMAARDARDSSRDTSPLAMADDAVLIDTTERSVDQVVDEVLRHL